MFLMDVLDQITLDPVCGMKVKPPTAAGSVEHGGKTWHFCGQGCVRKFQADPAKYDGSQTAPPIPAPSTDHASHGEYTCPMHPEIVTARPGPCPICGMALEPTTVTADSENPELIEMTRRFWVGEIGRAHV